MADTPLKDAGYIINEDTPFLDDAHLDMNGSRLTPWSLALIANMISKYGHVSIVGAHPTGEEIDWVPMLKALKEVRNG